MIIVNVKESDDEKHPELEYTLATQHYEAAADLESSVAGRTSTRRASRTSRNSISAPLIEEDEFNDSSDSGEAIIDMERLVPISAETFTATVLDMQDNNYHFVLNGKTWTVLMQRFPDDIIQRIVAKGTVYARMSPECKMQLVESLQVNFRQAGVLLSDVCFVSYLNLSIFSEYWLCCGILW